MVYGTYLTLGQKRWNQGDFSSTNKLTGTIYTTSAKTAAFNLTGYTLKVRIYKRWTTSDLFDKSATIVSGVNGTWEYAVVSGEMPKSGLYNLEIELSITGEVMSTFPVEFHVLSGPTA